ncbi:MAG: undecaprenyldiphospho-muramoylpentapeptide beta-N-acetylglucosaminyltransferase [Thermodesulfobacteriota bacterium]
MQRLVITTGGTGGHVFPALSVAQELVARHPRLQVLFVGGSHGKEADYAAKAGFDFVGLPVRGVMGRGLAAAGALLGLAVSTARALSVLRKFRPQAVVGFGGYASFPSVAAAALLGLPRAVHEQNALPGLANRMLGMLAQRVFLTHPDRQRCFDPSKAALTGNPVRRDILALAGAFAEPEREPATRRVLVVGGSQGARAMNDAVAAAAGDMASLGMELWHGTGELDYARIREGYAAAGLLDAGVKVAPFIEDMAAAYAWADLVLCRAGASTVAEVAALGKPAVLVPFPFATHNHQLENARTLADPGGAVLLTQEQLVRTDLARFLDGVFSIPGRLRDMALAARAAARPEAAARIAAEIEALAAGHKA